MIDGLDAEFGGKELAMGYLVYELDAVKNLPREHRERVENIRRRLEEEKVATPQTGASLPLFEALGHGFFKKRVGRFRLIAILHFVRLETGEHPVVVFVDFLSRSDPRYVEGGPEKLERLRQQYLPVLEARLLEIEGWARESLREQTPAVPLPSPPEDLLELLGPLRPQEKVSAVYESRLWREGMEGLETATEHAAVFRILQKIGDPQGESGVLRKEEDEEGCAVYFTVLVDPDTQQPHLYLVGVTSDHWGPAKKKLYEKEVESAFKRLKEEIIEPAHRGVLRSTEFSDRLGRQAERAYPFYVLADERLWNKVDKSREIFLPLSTEEIHVLEELLAGNGLPAIIEGRAGSGKTTLLTYFVPERLIGGEASSEISGPPRRLLFLTQSERLREVAEGTIRQFLERLWHERGRRRLALTPEYLTFHRFALGQLPTERRRRFADRSARGGWIGFFGFRALLNSPNRRIRSPLTREAGNPEIAWFIIRSYIKGLEPLNKRLFSQSVLPCDSLSGIFRHQWARRYVGTWFNLD